MHRRYCPKRCAAHRRFSTGCRIRRPVPSRDVPRMRQILQVSHFARWQLQGQAGAWVGAGGFAGTVLARDDSRAEGHGI